MAIDESHMIFLGYGNAFACLAVYSIWRFERCKFIETTMGIYPVIGMSIILCNIAERTTTYENYGKIKL